MAAAHAFLGQAANATPNATTNATTLQPWTTSTGDFAGAGICLAAVAILTPFVLLYCCTTVPAKLLESADEAQAKEQQPAQPQQVPPKPPRPVQRMLCWFWFALVLRVVWLLLNGLQVVGSPHCLTGIRCGPQVATTFVNRIAQITFFVAASRMLKPLGYAAHFKALSCEPWHEQQDNSVQYDLKCEIFATLAVMGW